MKVVLREEVNRMKQIMLHEVGVSKETHTKNKSLLFESTGGGKFIDEIINLTRGIKGVPVKSADELIEAVARGTSLRNLNPKQLEKLIVDIYKGGEAAAEGTKLFDDWMSSLKNEVEKGFRKNKRLKGKTLNDVDVTYGGVTKSMSDHLDDIVNVPGGVKDRFVSATEMIEDTLLDKQLILEGDPKEIIKLMEDNYGDVLKLVDPDGKIIKQMEDEVLLLQNGYERTVKEMEYLTKGLEDSLAKANKRLAARAGAGAKYADAIRDRLVRIFSYFVKRSPKFAKFIDIAANVLGKFKAYLEYWQIAGTMIKDTNLQKIINLAGTGSDDLLPILNLKVFGDILHLPGRVTKYALEFMMKGGKTIDIKSIEEMTSKFGKLTFYIGGAYYMGSLFHVLDTLRYVAKLLFNAPYLDICLIKATDEAVELGFEDIPVQNVEAGQKTVLGQMEDVVLGKGDANGNFKFDYPKFAKAIADVGEEKGIEYGFLGLMRTGKIADKKKWNDFIYPNGTKPYGEVPDWAIYVAGCDENGFSLSNFAKQERSYTYREMQSEQEDLMIYIDNTINKTKDAYNEIQGDARDFADSTGVSINNATEKVTSFGKNAKKVVLDKELRKTISDLTQKCYVDQDEKACAELKTMLDEINSFGTEAEVSTEEAKKIKSQLGV